MVRVPSIFRRGRDDPGLEALIPVGENSEIPWEGGRKLKEWWFAARGDRDVPPASAFHPRVVGRHLPTTALYDVLPEEPFFRVRLAGEEYRRAAGRPLKGITHRDVPNAGPIFARFRWAVENRAPYMVVDLPLLWAGKEYMLFSSLVVPLADEEGRIIRLVSQNRYRMME
ncbi:MAG: hypothetical protein KatS3mg119_1063 [Rhodothalassiaceae bacterium]|nr:MAG: hypothetical protein KatS3mg119_1063 [Rhodothalassiaceae bacterium]